MTAINGQDSLGGIFAEFNMAVLSMPSKRNEAVIALYLFGLTLYLWISGIVCENCRYRWKLSDLIVESSVCFYGHYVCSVSLVKYRHF
jgi:hypothetical protein